MSPEETASVTITILYRKNLPIHFTLTRIRSIGMKNL